MKTVRIGMFYFIPRKNLPGVTMSKVRTRVPSDTMSRVLRLRSMSGKNVLIDRIPVAVLEDDMS